MEIKEAFQVLIEALEAGNKNGAYTLTNATIIYQAVQTVGKALDIPEEVTTIAEDSGDSKVKGKE